MKKLVSLMVTLLLLIGMVSPVSAKSEIKTDITLEQAINIAKQTFNLSTEGYKFTSEYNENSYERSMWRLSWNKEKEPSSSIYVTVDSETGEILSMDRWEYSNTVQSKIPKYTREQALKTAQEIAQKIQPENFKQTKLYEGKISGIIPYYKTYESSDAYAFNFIRVVNGIEMQDNGINITLDRNTLKMTHYQYNWDKGPFPEVSKAMTLDAAKKLFREKLGIELSYRLIYDYEKKTETPILVYALKDGNYPIDAITGDVIKNVYRGGLGDYTAKEAANTSTGSSLTPEEQAGVDDTSKLISKETAIESVTKIVPKIADFKLSLTNANLYTNTIRKTYTWNLSWNTQDKDAKLQYYVNAQVNAQNSELISFNISSNDYNADNSKEPVYTKEQAKEIAEKFIKGLQPEKFAATEYRENRESEIYADKFPTNYYFNYVNKQNGALCPFNNFNISIDSNTGEVVSYGMEWVNINLPSTEGSLSLDDAYKALYNNLDYTLQYIKYIDYSKSSNNTPEIKLAYVLENFSGMIDSKTGAVLDSMGKPVKEAKKVEYSDIKGNAAEKDIQLLIEMGIIEDENTKYNPNGEMLQKDFIKMLVRAMEPYMFVYNTYTDSSSDEYEKYYKIAIERKIISEKEKQPNSQISKQITAKMLVRALNVGFVGDLSNIYYLPFKDAKLVGNQYKGYVAIASELGMVPAEKGYFNPSRHVLRGEAATILVNFLKVDVNVKE